MPSMMVVDDDTDTCLNLSDIFIDLGYRVEIFNTGQAAIERARAACFDIALLDLMLGGMDGVTLFRTLRSLCPKTEAILITGEPFHPRAAQHLEAGIHCMIAKPLDIPQVASVISSLCNEELAAPRQG